MVHSLYGWVDHIHTSLEVGYFPPPKKRKYHSQLAWKLLIWRQLRKYFRGPTAAAGAADSKAESGWLTVSVPLNGKNEETILQPAWSVWGYLLSNVLMLLSFQNRTKNHLFWSGFWGQRAWLTFKTRGIILRHSLLYIYKKFVFQNNWIKPVEAALHKSWRIFKFFILTAVVGAFFFFFWSKLELFSSR